MAHLQNRIRKIHQEVVRVNAAMHEIGGTREELDRVARLVAERRELERQLRAAERRTRHVADYAGTEHACGLHPTYRG